MSVLRKLYYNPESPAAFSDVNKLYEAAKRINNHLTRAETEAWLQAQETYTVHKQIRKKFQRNNYHVTNIDDLFQADLIDMHTLCKHNDNVRYLLAVIDVFSKYAWVVPLKSKKAQEVASAFEGIFKKDHRVPVNLQCDKGGEFSGRAMQNMLKKYDINFYVTKNPDVKAAVVERFNRTLKTKMFKYLTFKNNFRYIDVLQKLVKAYNNTVHRTIKLKPKDVNEKNILMVYNNVYGNARPIKQKKLLSVNDHVRISKYKHALEKGYKGNWSDEVFTIKNIINRNPVVYTIADLAGEPIDGVFYTEELQKVILSPATVYKIDKIIRKRHRNGRTELYVHWRGYPKKFDSWISAADLM